MVQYRAQLDPHGNPLEDDSGRFVKSGLFGFAVMKTAVAGVPTAHKNCVMASGNFSSLRPTKHPPTTTLNLRASLQCQKSPANNGFLFSLVKIKAAVAG
jgi:hypothetical protein